MEEFTTKFNTLRCIYTDMLDATDKFENLCPDAPRITLVPYPVMKKMSYIERDIMCLLDKMENGTGRDEAIKLYNKLAMQAADDFKFNFITEYSN